MPFLLVVLWLLASVHSRVVSCSSHLDQNGLYPKKGHEKLIRKMLSFYSMFQITCVFGNMCQNIGLRASLLLFWENCLASLKHFLLATVIDESWLLRSVSCVMHRRLIRKEIQIFARMACICTKIAIWCKIAEAFTFCGCDMLLIL